MKCELGAALRFVIKSGRELTVAQGDCGQSSGDHSQVPQITLVSWIKKKKNSSRFLAIVFTFHMEVKGNMICVMWGRLPQHEPWVKNGLNKCDFLG